MNKEHIKFYSVMIWATLGIIALLLSVYEHNDNLTLFIGLSLVGIARFVIIGIDISVDYIYKQLEDEK